MPYPTSPFEDTFNHDLITGLKDSNTEDTSSINLEDTLKWLCTAPTLTSYRVNTLKTSPESVFGAIQAQLSNVDCSKFSEDVILIKHNTIQKGLEKYPKEVVVDVDCAAAVLRGAHIYAPGVLGMMPSNTGDKVSVYADLAKKCLRGLIKPYTDCDKLFIANGIVKQNRREIFQSTPKGLAIEIYTTISGCPLLPDTFLPNGWALLQNVPSILCVKALNPQPDEIVLDMCAAPGNKTTHIAALMQNKGLLIALDKTPNKIRQLRKTCDDFGAKVLAFQADSCHIVSSDVQAIENGPPFAPKTFDRILLDAPCSVLGKRPQFTNKIPEKIIKSFIPLQRKLFTSAVTLLKPQGTLVYSTCTITLAENEGLVAWALRSYQDLRLAKIEGENPGWPGAGLTEEQRRMVHRFGPGQVHDSVGFFVACFVKNK